MIIKKVYSKKAFLIVALLLASLAACSPGADATQAIDAQPDTGEASSDDVPAQSTDTAESDVGEAADDEQPASEEDEGLTKIVFATSDPCQIVSQDQAEAVFGQAVESVIPASDAALSSCTFMAIPGEKFITVAVMEGEGAKRYFINEIAQLSDGCELSYSYSTNAEEPTPFPDEYKPLLDETIPALLKMDVDKFQECGSEFEAIPEFGPTAYSLYTFIEGGLVGIATDDLFVTFLFYDSVQDKATSLESDLELLRILFPGN